MNYEDTIKERLTAYRNRADNDELIDPREPFLDIDWTRDNRAYFTGLIKAKIVTRRAVDQATTDAKRAYIIRERLGDVPATPREFAKLFAKLVDARITYKGAVYVGDTVWTTLDLAREARLTAGELDLPFTRDAVNDGVEAHYVATRDDALGSIRDRISEKADFDWIALAEACFDCSAGSDFVAAVLKSYIWQIKRKMFHQTIPFPMMPVIVGQQGKGKSYFVRKLVDPIRELTSNSDFAAITDDRNIDLWRSFAIVMDEMGRAAKSDVETVKNVITSDWLERRPMRTNSTVTIRQQATMIGTSNVYLAEIIRDETGCRRFIQLLWSTSYVRGAIDEFDFGNAWGSIGEVDADPLAPFEERLAEVQSAERNYGVVELWLRNMVCSDWRNIVESSDNRMLTSEDAYRSFLTFREISTGGYESPQDRRTLQSFSHELRRVTATSDLGLEKVHTKSGNRWKITKRIFTLVGEE